MDSFNYVKRLKVQKNLSKKWVGYTQNFINYLFIDEEDFINLKKIVKKYFYDNSKTQEKLVFVYFMKQQDKGIFLGML
jgi:hypothetical protein